jgi:peptide deformylase
MSILKIITNPNDVLRKKSLKIDKNFVKTLEFKRLCLDMAQTMEKKDGVGLAAPQIGKNIRMIVVSTKDGVICMINPKITRKSLIKEWGEEGCLSVPSTFGQVKRHHKISFEYLDTECILKKEKAEGLLARVLQHEIDHLDGILFIDKAKNIEFIEVEK